MLLKALDVVTRGPADGGPAWAVASAVLAAGGGLLLAGRGRTAWAVTLVGCVAAVAEQPLELRLQHTVLLAWAALGALVARDDTDRLLLWRVLLSSLYGVAALAKLNESHLGGDALGLAVAAAPFGSGLLPVPPPGVLIAAALGLVAAEVLLAVTPWVPRLARPGLAVAACFHVLAVPLAGVTPAVALRLVVFGGTSLVLLAACTGRLPLHGRPARPVH